MPINLNLSYNGNDLPEEITQQLIDYAENTLNVPPSYLITKLHYEGLWGGSAIAQSNNNWGGMTWVVSWSDPYKRASGVTVTKGSPRPANEGGNYIYYDSVQDFLTDWSYLIRRGGIYNVADSYTFDEAVRGMFKYGGAMYDYATMNNTQGSKRRYELYLQGMKARRNAINNANNGVLDELDSNDYSTNPNPDKGNEEYDSIIEEVEKIDSEKDKIQNEFKDSLFTNFVDLFNPLLFQYGGSQTIGNSVIHVKKIYNDKYKISLTLNVNDFFENLFKENTEEVKEIEKEKNDKTEKDDEATPPEQPEKNNVPFFPHEKPYRITDYYGSRNNTHLGTDIAGEIPGTSYPIYATQDGTVTRSGWGDGNGWHVYINHTGDDYHSAYLHMIEKPLVDLGETVTKGQKIGMTGTTGYSFGVHLHFAISTVENDFFGSNTIDPEKYLKMRF